LDLGLIEISGLDLGLIEMSGLDLGLRDRITGAAAPVIWVTGSARVSGLDLGLGNRIAGAAAHVDSVRGFPGDKGVPGLDRGAGLDGVLARLGSTPRALGVGDRITGAAAPVIWVTGSGRVSGLDLGLIEMSGLDLGLIEMSGLDLGLRDRMTGAAAPVIWVAGSARVSGLDLGLGDRIAGAAAHVDSVRGFPGDKGVPGLDRGAGLDGVLARLRSTPRALGVGWGIRTEGVGPGQHSSVGLLVDLILIGL